jgi:all-trans-retinol 13,14-reductase
MSNIRHVLRSRSERAGDLTWSDRLRAPHGGAYGPANTPRQTALGRFGTRTPVGGLFLAGQGALASGVAPCLMSGRLAALAAERLVTTVTRTFHGVI